MAAYSRRGPPQMPIRKYIGSNMTYQKKKKVQSSENAHHSRFEHEEKREVSFHASIDAKRRKDTQKTQQSRQQNHRNAETIDTDEVLDVVSRDPWQFLNKLKSALGGVKVGV